MKYLGATKIKPLVVGSRIVLVLQGLFHYLHSHLQPWFTADVQAIRDEPDIASLMEGNYVGIHIRRTDKLIYDGGGKEAIPTEVRARRNIRHVLRTSGYQ